MTEEKKGLTVEWRALGLVTFYHDDWTLAFGVPREDQDVYLPSGPPTDGCHQHCESRCTTHCYHGWVWGGATEAYDCCLDYLGLGPVMLLCWRGGTEPPKAVRAVGWACRKAADVIDDALTFAEEKFCGGRVPGGALGRLDAWLSTTAVGRLTRQAQFLDPNECGHPACLPRQPCKFPEDD